MKLKAVFFDFGGTIDLYPLIWEDAVKASGKMLLMLKKKGLDLTDRYSNEDFLELINDRLAGYKKWKKQTLIELTGDDVWKRYLLFDTPGIESLDPDTAEDLTLLLETGRYTRILRPEMNEVMEELVRTNLHFGIISNVLSLTQVPINLIEYRLDKYFSQVVLSAEFGKVKPDVSIFHHAVDEAGFLPGECIYVGNSPSKDITGAKKAGFKAAVQIEYVDDSDDTTDPGMEPDFYIKSMKELPEIVTALLESD